MLARFCDVSPRMCCLAVQSAQKHVRNLLHGGLTPPGEGRRNSAPSSRNQNSIKLGFCLVSSCTKLWTA